MHADRIDIGAIEQSLIGGRVIALDPLDQFELAQQLGPGLVDGPFGELVEGLFSLDRRSRVSGGGIGRRREE
jgi:hypothetical protein